MSDPVNYTPPRAPRYGAFADATAVTNLDAETTTQEIVLWEAGECDRKGYRFKWRTQVDVTARNSSDTNRVRVYAVSEGETPVVLSDSGAAGAAAGTSLTAEGDLHVVTLGPAGTGRAIGSSQSRLSGATAVVNGTLDNAAALSTLKRTMLRVTILQSAASAGNSAICTDIQAHTLPSQEGL